MHKELLTIHFLWILPVILPCDFEKLAKIGKPRMFGYLTNSDELIFLNAVMLFNHSYILLNCISFVINFLFDTQSSPYNSDLFSFWFSRKYWTK